MLTTQSKQNLRRQMRQKRRELDEHQQDKAARGLMNNLLKVQPFMRAKRISLYYPNDGEIDPGLVMARAMEFSKQCYFPLILTGRKPKMYFAPVHPACRLRPDRMGILTPVVASSQWLKPSQLDLVLLPLVSFDARGSRIGMGGGFYDVSFAFLGSRVNWRRPKLIGIAHEIQKVESITTDHWDVPLEMIVTDQSVYRVSGGE